MHCRRLEHNLSLMKSNISEAERIVEKTRTRFQEKESNLKKGQVERISQEYPIKLIK